MAKDNAKDNRADAAGEPEKQRSAFNRWLYRMGIFVTPEEQARLRELSVRDRLLEQSIKQLLLAVPLVLLLGGAYKGWVGVQWAVVGCVVVFAGLILFQRFEPGAPEPTSKDPRAKHPKAKDPGPRDPKKPGPRAPKGKR